ncbi:NUDIX hydrolase [Nocardia nova]|uniref:NUDIX hydrolase n=1 Tax=Nocardia nova TaxID=37330 RepID=UPI001C681A4B|nr:NUDIX hydrolase [Nocardia nova]
MTEYSWKFCPRCREILQRFGCGSEAHLECSKCGFTKYDNPLPTTIGIVARDSKILLLQRNIEPARGKWVGIGGFLAGNETFEENLRRESYEEIGQNVRTIHYLGSFTSIYGDTGLRTVGVAFLCRLEGQHPLKISDESSTYGWFDIFDFPEIAFADVASAIAAAVPILS